MKSCPLFPLRTVLFPYGKLSLRIFEPRYLEMVSERLKSDQPFGVVSIREGNEAGKAATFHKFGTLATIVDFDQQSDGLLGLTCTGGSRFQVLDHHVSDSQLISASVQLVQERHGEIESDEDRRALEDVSKVLKVILENEGMREYRKTLTERWGDPSWVVFQVAEILPIGPDVRQSILEMSLKERLWLIRRMIEANEQG